VVAAAAAAGSGEVVLLLAVQHLKVRGGFMQDEHSSGMAQRVVDG
jgi:hypothetical protein